MSRFLKHWGKLNIKTLVTGFGGLDKRHHWANALPLADQQLLVVARPGQTPFLQPFWTGQVQHLARSRSTGY